MTQTFVDVDPLLPNLHPASTKSENPKLDKNQLLARTKEYHRSKHAEDQASNILYLHLSEISDPEVKKLFESCACVLIDANFPIKLNKPDVQCEKVSKKKGVDSVGETTKTKKHCSGNNIEAPGGEKSEKKKKKKKKKDTQNNETSQTDDNHTEKKRSPKKKKLSSVSDLVSQPLVPSSTKPPLSSQQLIYPQVSPLSLTSQHVPPCAPFSIGPVITNPITSLYPSVNLISSIPPITTISTAHSLSGRKVSVVFTPKTGSIGGNSNN